MILSLLKGPLIDQKMGRLSSQMTQFRYIKILTWLQGLGEQNKGNKLSIPQYCSSFFFFFFFLGGGGYPTNPWSQVRIVIYQKWPNLLLQNSLVG